MRFATLFLTVLAIAPALTVAAPIAPEHFEELEARWNLKGLVHKAANAYRKVAPIVRKVAPVVKTLAPLILKREDEMEEQLHRRALPGTPTSPTLASNAAAHAFDKRDEYEHLEARDWEAFVEEA